MEDLNELILLFFVIDGTHNTLTIGFFVSYVLIGFKFYKIFVFSRYECSFL